MFKSSPTSRLAACQPAVACAPHLPRTTTMPKQGGKRADLPTVIDLFSGAGGLSAGFHQEGFRVVACVENNRDAVATYRESMVRRKSPQTTILETDIRSPDVLQRLRDTLQGGTLDVLVGGPPCQDFSPARLKSKKCTERVSLVSDYLRVLADLRPRVFLFENVPGLLRADEGAHWATIRRKLGRLRYSVVHKVLNAEDFGVPQRRSRLFVMGWLEGTHSAYAFPTPDGPRVTVREAISHLKPLRAGSGDHNDPNHRARAHSAEIVEYMRQIPPGGSWRNCREYRVLTCHLRHTGHYDVYGRINYDAIGPTITGGCTNPSRGRFIHPTQNRGLTVREAALLQTFPEDWRFSGGIESASQQVGNAVPVKLGAALARSVRSALLG